MRLNKAYKEMEWKETGMAVGAVSDKMVQEGFPEEVLFGIRTRECTGDWHWRSRQRAFQGEEAARAKALR